LALQDDKSVLEMAIKGPSPPSISPSVNTTTISRTIQYHQLIQISQVHKITTTSINMQLKNIFALLALTIVGAVAAPNNHPKPPPPPPKPSPPVINHQEVCITPPVNSFI
jgi:hypothetical protein